MPVFTSGLTSSQPPPSNPGTRTVDGVMEYWCNCVDPTGKFKCNGAMTQVTKSTYYRHNPQGSGRGRKRRRVGRVGRQGSDMEEDDAQRPSGSFHEHGSHGDEPGTLGAGGTTQDTSGLQDRRMDRERSASTSRAPSEDREGPRADTPSVTQEPLRTPEGAREPPPAQQQSQNPGVPPIPEDEDDEASAHIEHIDIALKFIDALKKVRLDDGSTPLSLRHILQNPSKELLSIENPDTRLSIDLYALTYNASEVHYDIARKAILRRWPNAQVLTFPQCKKLVQQLTGVVALVHDMCPNSCMAYTAIFSERTTCFFCGTNRFELRNGKLVPLQRFYSIPLGPILQSLYSTPENAHLMKYRQRKTRDIFQNSPRDEHGQMCVQKFDDIFCGSEYLNAVTDNKIGDDDIMVLTSVDGAQLLRNVDSNTWMYIWEILDLPPEFRYRGQYVFPGAVIPGPNKPKHLDSFMYPGLAHLRALQVDGLQIWDAEIDRTFTSRPFEAFGTGDGPALIHFSGLVGHTGNMGCRIYCGMKGRRDETALTKYYPAMFKPQYTIGRLEATAHPDVNILNILHHVEKPGVITKIYERNLNVLQNSRTQADYLSARLDTGISKPSLFSALSHRFSIPGCFPSDTMHLFGANVTSLVLSLFMGTIDHDKLDKPENWPWCVLVGTFWEHVGDIIDLWRQYLPGEITHPPRNPKEKMNSGYKTEEYEYLVYKFMPGLLYGVLPDEYWEHFCRLVAGIQLMLQRELSYAEIETAHGHLLTYVIDFERLYIQRKPNRIHFARPCLHNLVHLASETLRLGPLALLSQYTLESTIGSLTAEIRQWSNMYMNLSERGIRRTQRNILCARFGVTPTPSRPSDNTLPSNLEPSSNTDSSDTEREAENTARIPRPKRTTPIIFPGGYRMVGPKDRYKRRMNPEETEAFSNFYGDIGDNVPRILKYGSLHLPNGQKAHSRWGELRRKKVRIARMIKAAITG